MANEILTKSLAISWNAQIVAYTTEFNFSISSETIDINTISTSEWDQKIAGKKSFTFSTAGLVASTTPAGEAGFNDLMDAIMSADQAPVEVFIAKPTPASGDVYYKGDALLTSLDFSPSMNDKVTYSASLEGTGALVKETVV